MPLGKPQSDTGYGRPGISRRAWGEKERERERREGVRGVCERLNRLAAVKSSGNARDPPFVSISWVPAKSDKGGRAGVSPL